MARSSYNQSSDGQAVIAAQYGHLTFSNFNKTLAGTGTIFVAGTFTPGIRRGHAHRRQHDQLQRRRCADNTRVQLFQPVDGDRSLASTALLW